ncbi:secretion protein EspO, partial [Escherichia coli]|nr:secretion protein EspO [Escherichia coli]EFN9991983.1 secretion protein EspO [Escherichia coli]EFO1742188.1 secretion protein EspO [Escherichia coli]
MPFSIKNIFSNTKGSYLEISGPVQDKSVPKNCTLISTTCTINGYTVLNRRSCCFDMS